VSDLDVEVVRIEGEPISIRLNGQEFSCEEETFQTIIPKKFLTGLRLSEIPEDVTIKPVESIDDHVIEAHNDIGLSLYSDGSASAWGNGKPNAPLLSLGYFLLLLAGYHVVARPALGLVFRHFAGPSKPRHGSTSQEPT
jgi:hypothetical protein